MIVVQKFGGTSVKNEESRKKVVERIVECFKEGNKVAVVVSAMGRLPEPYATDTLLNLALHIDPHAPKRDLDLLASCGETISSVVISTMLNSMGISAMAITGFQAGIITDDEFTKAKVLKVNAARIKDLLDQGIIPIITGFQGMTENGDISTLGRGGSDTTASIIGEAISADIIEIYTDVNGVMTTDPKICKEARTISNMQYDELFQMADSGANVIHKDAAYIAKRANIKLKIRNTFTSELGTCISNDCSNTEDAVFTGIAHLKDRVKMNLYCGDIEMTKAFDEIAESHISLDMINISLNEAVFTIHAQNLEKTEEILKKQKIRYEVCNDCSKVTVLGRMTGVPGVMNTILKSLASKKIEVLQTVDSLVSISVLIKTENIHEAISTLHEELKLG